MATVAAPPRRAVPDVDLHLPERLARLPKWLVAGGFLLGLMALSGFLRSRYLSGQFWMDEALSVGIASHHLTAIPGVLRHDGSPPLFYLMLHVWMSVFGNSESATHAMSLTFGLLTIPIGMWAGWSLFGERAGYMAAVLFAFSSFLTEYSQETRMYALMGLLGLLAAAAFVHAFVFRRRKYLILFAVAQALMLYTHAWGIFFGVGAVLALIPVVHASDDRRAVIRDARARLRAAPAILFLPWLPNFIYQATHTAAPWDSSPRFGAPVQLSRDLLGGDRVTVALLIGAVIGLADLFKRGAPSRRLRTAMWALIVLPARHAGPRLDRFADHPGLGLALLRADRWARCCCWPHSASRGRGSSAGWSSAPASIFLANPASFTPKYKSDMRDVGGEMAPLVHPGDLVVVGQPEQVPLAWYYLPGGLRYANTIGPIADPRYMDWVNALIASSPRKPSRRSRR